MSSTLEIRGSIPAIVRNDDGLYEGNLVSYFRAVFNHAQNLCNPYHNFRHMCHVLWLCHEACKFYTENSMYRRDMRNLLIAALFHDFDHTGQAGPDSVNIARAIAGLEKHLAPEDRDELPAIVAIIKATEFPYTVPSDQLELPEQIIRDADLSQGLSVAWIQQTVFGLATEWRKTPLEVLKMQMPFFTGLKFATVWAHRQFPAAKVEEKIAEAQELFDILSGEPVAVG